LLLLCVAVPFVVIATATSTHSLLLLCVAVPFVHVLFAVFIVLSFVVVAVVIYTT
jgi:hypothetical protein